MATYVVGDVQGCFESLSALLARVGFGATDTLWLVGDLVNRGPQSLAALRYVRDLGDRAQLVLGNHDLHLIAVAHGFARTKGKDTLREILDAPDCDELINWLMQRPLMHQEHGWIMVHAGLPPDWDEAVASQCAAELERVLRSDKSSRYLQKMYGNKPDAWSPKLKGADRLRFITNALTRMRYVRTDGRLTLTEKGPPGTASSGLVPWFAHPKRRSAESRIVFGHWATLQFHQAVKPRYNVYPLDNGCIWGRQLTAMRLDDEKIFEVDAVERV